MAAFVGVHFGQTERLVGTETNVWARYLPDVVLGRIERKIVGKKQIETETLVYLSQSTERDLIVFPEHAFRVIDWLSSNNHKIISWEAFLRGKKETVRTQKYGDSQDQLEGRFSCRNVEQLKEAINSANERWVAEGIEEKLIICLTLEEKLVRPVQRISTGTRVAAGILGGLCFALSVLLFFVSFNGENVRFEEFWSGLLSALVGGPIFLYGAITGRGELPFLEDPFAIGKAMNRRKFRTETGANRW